MNNVFNEMTGVSNHLFDAAHKYIDENKDKEHMPTAILSGASFFLARVILAYTNNHKLRLEILKQVSKTMKEFIVKEGEET